MFQFLKSFFGQKATAMSINPVDPLILVERNSLLRLTGRYPEERVLLGLLSKYGEVKLELSSEQLQNSLHGLFRLIGPEGMQYFFQLLDVPLDMPSDDDEEALIRHAFRKIQASIVSNPRSHEKGLCILKYVTEENSPWQMLEILSRNTRMRERKAEPTEESKNTPATVVPVAAQGIPRELMVQAKELYPPTALIVYHALKWLNQDEIDSLRILADSANSKPQYDFIMLLDTAVKEKIAEGQNPKALPGELPLITGDGSQTPQALH